MIMSAVGALLTEQTPPRFHPPSATWESDFLRNHLPSTKNFMSKPLDIKGKSAQDKPAVERWFEQYTNYVN